jgi:glycosyltransferase involved in cell wall biosynthesis
VEGLDGSVLRICCLPVAGKGNPYQTLMMEGLANSPQLEVMHGKDGKFFAAIRSVWAYRPDVIHYDWIERFFYRRRPWWTWLNAPAFLLELLIVRYVLGCRLVWTMHNLRSHDRPPSWIEKWTRRRFARLCEWIRVFQTSTLGRAAEYLGLPQDRFRIVPEGSYVGYYPEGADRGESRECLGVEPNDFVLLYLGNVRPYKGLEELIDAFAQSGSHAWRLIIAGRPYQQAYARLVEERADGVQGVKLHLRFIEDEALQTYFAASDVVVLPFGAIENSGSAILAMGFGKPVLAPRLGALADRLSHQAELLYAPGRLVEGLRSLKASDRRQLERTGQRNRGRVQRHDWADFGSTFEELFEHP